jgi:hypothetical protein
MEITATNMAAMSADTAKATFGAEVVTKTLDHMNQSQTGGLSQDYEFQKDVLSSAYASSGKIINALV